MADGSITFSTKVDNREAQRELAKLQREIQKLEKEVAKSEGAKLPLVDQAKELGARLDEAKAKLAALQDKQIAVNQALSGNNQQAYIDAYAQKSATDSSVTAQQAEVYGLQKKWDSVNLKIDQYNQKIAQANSVIAVQSAKAGELSAKQTAGGANMAAAMMKAQAAAKNFEVRLGMIAKRVLVFSLISKALISIVSYMGRAMKTNKEYAAQLAKLKGALLTAFQPIYEFVIPALIALMRIATSVVQAVAHVFSLLGGKTAAENAQKAKALYEEAKAIENVGKAAKKASKSLAGFDEINALGGSNNSANSASTSTTIPDFSDFSTDEYKNKIDELTVYISGALLALGAILTFSGANIPLGIVLLAAGAIGLVSEITANWGCMSEELKKAITRVLGVLGGAVLVIGAILAFSGANIPLGIGLMVFGAASLGTAIALNWNTITEALKGPIGGVVAIVSTALLAIGVILCFTGVALPLGIALIAAGAAGLATVTALNWNTLKEKLQGPIGGIVAIASAALLAIGVILCFTGVALPLGIALIAAGAAGLATVTALNWNTVKEKLVAVIAGIVSVIGASLIVIGVLLLLSGAGLGLGLALIAAGIAASYAAWKLDDNPVTRFVKKLANCVIGIINRVITAINDMFHISYKGLKLLGETVIPAFDVRLVNIPKIPLLAQGAVIPPNAPFMAVVGDQKHGTNIEAPLATIQEAVALVMQDQTSAILAGFEASVGVQREILEAVLGIQIGDDVIGNAVARYSKKQAVIRGGVL